MNQHSSKGLEFETVIIPAMEQGILPYYRNPELEEAENEIAEERRLLYVGVTRARSNIYLLYSGHFERYGNHYHKGHSQFLTEMGLVPSSSIG